MRLSTFCRRYPTIAERLQYLSDHVLALETQQMPDESAAHGPLTPVRPHYRATVGGVQVTDWLNSKQAAWQQAESFLATWNGDFSYRSRSPQAPTARASLQLISSR